MLKQAFIQHLNECSKDVSDFLRYMSFWLDEPISEIKSHDEKKIKDGKPFNGIIIIEEDNEYISETMNILLNDLVEQMIRDKVTLSLATSKDKHAISALDNPKRLVITRLKSIDSYAKDLTCA